jgi:hypothetical protein
LVVRKPFNVTLIQPPGYIHSLALKEAAEYLHFMLTACGFPSRLSRNHLSLDAHNIIFCGHLLRERDLPRIPADSIVFNSEQLDDAGGWHLASGVYARMLDSFHIWDYSLRNLAGIRHERKSFIPFLYCRELVRSGMRRTPGRTLLFYGALTERRKRILERLESAGVPVEAVFGEYDRARDERLSRAWAVLNLHKTDDLAVFEPIRCFYPLINGVPVISEAVENDATAAPFRDAMLFFERAALGEQIKRLYDRPEAFEAESARRIARFTETSGKTEIAAAAEKFLSGVRA